VDEYDTLGQGSSGSGSSAAVAAGAAAADRKRIPAAALVGGAVLVAALVIAGAIFLRGGGSQRQTAAPPLRFSTVTNRGAINGAALSPDGRYLAYSITLDGDRSIWVRQVATGSDVMVLPPPQKVAPTGLTFTPDGDYLYYLSADPDRSGYNAVFELPTLGGTPRKRAYDVDSRVSFSPDGKRVCFRRGAPHKNQWLLVVLDLASGVERTLASMALPGEFGPPAWSPDGTRIAVIETRGGQSLGTSMATYRVEDGRREPLGTQAWFDANDLVWLPDGSGLLVSAFDASTLTEDQLWTLSFPDGRAERVTRDPHSYLDLSVSADGSSLGAVRRRRESNLWVTLPTGDRNVRQVTFGSAEEGGVRVFDPAPDGSILFDAVKDGSAQIFTTGPDGTGERSITSGQKIAVAPRVTSRGIFYVHAGEDLTGHIWRADANGENARALTSGKGERIVDISPDGRTVLFSREEVPDVLWSVSSDGGEPVRLGASSNPSALFSPDGSRILHVLVHEVDGQGAFTPQIIPARPGAPEPMMPALPPRAFDFEWTPDGKALTYLHPTNELRNLYRLRLDGGSPEEITRLTDGRIEQHRWSPDGARIVLRRNNGNADNLWVVGADGGNPVAVTDFESGSITDMKWAPDGSRIIFTYGTSGQNVVLIRDFRPKKL
jgi:Tol biopolymer transport system component